MRGGKDPSQGQTVVLGRPLPVALVTCRGLHINIGIDPILEKHNCVCEIIKV